MTKEEMECVILRHIDKDGMWVGPGLRLGVARRYLKEYPDGRAARIARKVLEE